MPDQQEYRVRQQDKLPPELHSDSLVEEVNIAESGEGDDIEDDADDGDDGNDDDHVAPDQFDILWLTAAF